MDKLPPKPSSSSYERPKNSRRDSNRDRRRREKEKDKETRRTNDRDRNHHTHARSPSPIGSSSKRRRTEGSRKGKEKAYEEELEPGEIEAEPPKSFNIGDDFIPFVASDDEMPSEENTRSPKDSRRRDKMPEREWDRGKPPRRDRDEDSGGTKRKHDLVYDGDDGWAYRRRQQYGSPTQRKTPWVTHVDWDSCHNVAEMLHREVEAFVKYMSPSPVEDEIRGLVVQLVSKALKSRFPDARILPFGSYETKLYLPSGDIDLVIDSDAMAYSNKVTVLHALANTLKRAGITSKVTIIAKAKVPIVKFVTNFGRLNVDISVNQGNGVVAGQIVNGFLQDMRGCGFALRSLVVIAKAFLNQRGMNEVYTGGLGSYSIVCLAISFLQMHPKIRRGEIDAEKNLGVLVMEFFELYGRYFNYEEVGISIRNGGTYFSKRRRRWHDPTKSHLLSIEDPTDPSNDISKGSYGIGKVRQTFAGAHDIMQAAAFLRAGILTSRREGRSYPLRQSTSPEEMSILSSILGVTQETINNRLLLQEVYDRRVLHQLLGVEPKASIVIAEVPTEHRNGWTSQSTSKQAASSVEEAWEADMELGSSDGEPNRHLPYDDAEESGKYDVAKRQSLQARLNGGRFEALAVYTTDEEDEDPQEESLDEVERQAEDRSGRQLKAGLMQRRRDYWLSKGNGADGDDSS
ncbi:hypothetical protein F5I97DRAFT_2052779 [Phlebopus sp. FC_14]|nr:hypothetical protein F5I97DRAFT_2052779 [Phlebopus sp. FC_14]